MKNKYFPEEEIQEDDLYFTCYMIERVARKLHQRNSYVVNSIGKEELEYLISAASVLHSDNPVGVEDDWIEQYSLENGNFDVTDVDYNFADDVPDALYMGRVYKKLILNTLQPGETEVEGIIRVYNDTICEVIDDYNCSAHYEPAHEIVKAYYDGGF